MKAYIKGHYTPQDTVAVLVGAFDPQKGFDEISKRLGHLKGALEKLAPRKQKFFSPIDEITVTKDINQAQIALGYRTFGFDDRRKYAASVFDAIMGRGMSSRLFQEVREKRGLSYDIGSRMQFFSDAGIWSVTAGVDPSKIDMALSTVDAQLKRILTKRVSAAELKRTKEFLTGNFRLSHERVQSKLFFYAQTVMAYGRVVSPEEQVDGVRSVTCKDVSEVAEAILRPKMRSLSIVKPL
jgi:predicted Zn-dependent peptidase